MKRTKKLIATMICASVALSTCSCSKKFEGNVLDAADALGKNIVDRNYKKIEKLAQKGDDELEELLTFEDDSDEKNIEAREIIASTLSYEVDDKSFEGDFMGKEGSIDIVFTYVDYESVTDDGFFIDIDSFSEAIDDCKDTVEVKLTFDFINDSGDCVCTNIGDIEKVFPYADEEFNFALPPEEYAGDVTFLGLNNGNGYLDVSSVSCELAVEGDGQLMDWDYYFVVDLDYVQIYESEVMTAPAGESLSAVYSETDTLEAGTYTISFFTDSRVLLGMDSVTVEQTVVTPSPTPTLAPDYTDSEPNPGPYFICPEGSAVTLPDTDVTINLPDGISCIDSDSAAYQEIVAGGSLEENLCFIACDQSDSEYVMCVYGADVAYDSERSVSAMSNTVDNLESNHLAAGDGVERSSQDYTIGDRTFTIYTLRFEDAVTGRVNYYHCGVIGDSDTTYMLFLGSVGVPCVDAYMEGMTIG